jgi:quinol monooxygenase YgiN
MNERKPTESQAKAAMTKDLYTEYTARPGHEHRVADMIRELTSMSVSQPGVLQFRSYTLDREPRRYFLLERYLNEQSFEAHITSALRQRFTDEISQHLEVSPPSLTMLNTVA